MNKLYGLLVNDPEPGKYYYRRSTQKVGAGKAVAALIPQTSDKDYLQYSADKLCELCMAVLPDDFKSLDPENTYMHPATPVAAAETYVTGVPGTVKVSTYDAQVAYTWINRQVRFVYDGASTFTFDGRAIAWGANGTGMFEYAGIRIAFTGTAAGPFQGLMTFVRKPTIDMLKLADKVSAVNVEWHPEFEIYRDSTLKTQRVAAFTLNTLKNSL